MYKSIVFASNYDNMYCFSTLHGRDAKLDNNYPLKLNLIKGYSNIFGNFVVRIPQNMANVDLFKTLF